MVEFLSSYAEETTAIEHAVSICIQQIFAIFVVVSLLFIIVNIKLERSGFFLYFWPIITIASGIVGFLACKLFFTAMWHQGVIPVLMWTCLILHFLQYIFNNLHYALNSQ